jgi:hypothetical protein
LAILMPWVMDRLQNVVACELLGSVVGSAVSYCIAPCMKGGRLRVLVFPE